jgi:biotin-dependent carboxylase-like uncharacterized protein
MPFVPPRLRALSDTVIALTGADFAPRLDGVLAPMWQAVPVAKGTDLTFRGRRSGVRGYLAVAGGIDVPVVLGSRSTYLRASLGGFEGRLLRAGDRLSVAKAPTSPVTGRRLASEHVPDYPRSHVLRVVLGPQDDRFTPAGIATFLSAAYHVSEQSDRMGYRLEGPAIEHWGGADIISDGTPAGAVQVTGDNKPIILLADRGTAGGYTKIATVITVDLPLLAQAGPGDRVRFQAIDVEAAHRALRQREAVIALVATSRPRVFARRHFRADADGIMLDALGPFEEQHGDREGIAPPKRVSVVVDGHEVPVDIRRAGDEPWATGPGEATVTDRQRAAAAAIAAAVVVETEPAPVDYPIVL